jgi:Spherulation-specific family 4
MLINIIIFSLTLSAYSIATSPGTVVPLYWSALSVNGACTEPGWLAVGNSAIANRTIAIINPASGPGASQIQDFTICINFLKSKKVKVIGYVLVKKCHQAADK